MSRRVNSSIRKCFSSIKRVETSIGRGGSLVISLEAWYTYGYLPLTDGMGAPLSILLKPATHYHVSTV